MNHAIAPNAAWRLRETRPYHISNAVTRAWAASSKIRYKHSISPGFSTLSTSSFDEALRLITGPIQLLGVGGVLDSVYSPKQGGEKLGRYVD